MQPYKPMEEEGSPTEEAPLGGQPSAAQPMTVASPPRQAPSNQVRPRIINSHGTVKPVCNHHLFNKINCLWFIQ